MTAVAPRFRGQQASSRSQHLIGAATATAIALAAVVGIVTESAAIAYFAIGAGAGYSLSGSV